MEEEIIIFAIKYKTEIVIAAAVIFIVCLFCWYKCRNADDIKISIRKDNRTIRLKSGYADKDYHGWRTDSVISDLNDALQPVRNGEKKRIRIGVGAGTGSLEKAVRKYLNANRYLSWSFEESKKRFFVPANKFKVRQGEIFCMHLFSSNNSIYIKIAIFFRWKSCFINT